MKIKKKKADANEWVEGKQGNKLTQKGGKRNGEEWKSREWKKEQENDTSARAHYTIYIYIYIYTHTHTYTFIFICQTPGSFRVLQRKERTTSWTI